VAVGSRPVPLVAAFLLGALVGGALVWALGPARTTPDDVDRNAPVVGAPRVAGAEPEPGLGVAERGPQHRDVARGTDATTRPEARDVEDEGGLDSFGSVEPGRIDVRGAFADGTPVVEGDAYALPAGGVGGDSVEDFARARIGEGPIPIEASGLYDVGLRSGELVVLKTDVRVVAGTTTRVDLVLPRTAPVRVRVEANDLSWGGVDGRVELTSVDEGALYFPGRGGSARVRAGVDFAGPGEYATVPLPPGSVLRVFASAREEVEDPAQSKAHGRTIRVKRLHSTLALVPSRDTVAPGESLSVSLAPAGLLVATFSMPSGVWFGTRSLRARGGGRDLPVHAVGVGNPDRVIATVSVTGGDVHLSWSGDKVVSGEARFQVPKGARVESEIEVKPREEAWVPVVLGGPPPSDGFELFYARTTDATEFEIEPRGFDVAGGEALRVPASWRGGLVVGIGGVDATASDVVRVPESGPLEVALRPAGGVVVVLDRDVDPRAGALTVSTADARPLVTDRRFRRLGVVATVETGTRIAGLPEGEHVFRVRMNGVPLPDVKVHVVAGRIVPLRIGR
jgi:hypothetical protein